MAIMIKILMMTRTVHRRRGCPVNRCNRRSWGTASPRWVIFIWSIHIILICVLLTSFLSCSNRTTSTARSRPAASSIARSRTETTRWTSTSASCTSRSTSHPPSSPFPWPRPPWPGVQSIPRLVWDSEGLQSVETRRHPGQTDAEAHQVQPLVEGTHIVIRIMMMMLSMVLWSLRFFDQMTI